MPDNQPKVNRDQHPTVREVLEGDAPFPDSTQASHNPNTGMYEYHDNTTNVDLVKDKDSGLFLPRPTTKQVTRLIFDGGLSFDVSESYDEVCARLAETKPGQDITFSGPVFPDEPVLLKSSILKKLAVITVDYRDLKEIELALKQKEYNLRMAESQMSGQQPRIGVPINAPLPFPFDRKHKH